MATHTELRLIAKVIATSDFRTVLKRKITPGMFSQPEASLMFREIWNYYHNNRHQGRVPTRGYMKEKFPSSFKGKQAKTKETIEELCERVREAFITKRLLKMSEKGVNQAMENPYGTIEEMREELIKLQAMSASSRDVVLSEAAGELIDEYDLVKHARGMTGVPWPWPELNEITGGMKKQEFILLYGRLKSMKSFTAISAGVYAYRWANRRVLFYSAEMSPMLVAKRSAACYARADYKKVRMASLTPTKEERFKRMLWQMSEDEEEAAKEGSRPAFLIASDTDDPGGTGGISHIEAKAQEFEPDLVIVDSFYRLQDTRTQRADFDWRVQANLNRELKSLAQRLDVPVIGVTQANRASNKMAAAEGMEDVAFTDAGGQETDFGMRIVKGRKDGEIKGSPTTLYMIIPAAREVEQSGFVIKFKPFVMNKFHNWLSQQDVIDINTAEKSAANKNRGREERSKAEVRSDDSFLDKKRERVAQ